MTPTERMQLKNAALRVLHAPGGPLSTAGSIQPVLEMALVFDGALTKEAAANAGAQLISALKSADEIFRNVRCNLVFWLSDEKITHQPAATAMIQIGSCFADWDRLTGEVRPCRPKRLELLLADLKKFQARARLLLLVTEGDWQVIDRELLQQSLQPFLKQRILIVTPEKIFGGSQILAGLSE